MTSPPCEHPSGDLFLAHNEQIAVEPPTSASILAIAAHPDDIERWCAGTLARAIDAGAEVRLLLVTAGECGSDDPATSPEELARQRTAEAEAAGKLLGLAGILAGVATGAALPGATDGRGGGQRGDEGLNARVVQRRGAVGHGFAGGGRRPEPRTRWREAQEPAVRGGDLGQLQQALRHLAVVRYDVVRPGGD